MPLSIPPSSDHIPPHNVDAEQALLGSILMSSAARLEVFGRLSSTDFYRPAHAKIYAAAHELFLFDHPLDHVSLADRLEAKGELEQVGGKGYLIDLSQAVPTASNALGYAKIIRRDARLRATIEAAMTTLSLAYSGDENASDVGLGLMLGIQDTGRSSMEPISEVTQRRLDSYGSPTPTIAIPGSTQRLHFGDTIVLAGFESTGKTALAIQCVDVWRKTEKCLFLSYEMSADEIADRFIARHTHVSTEIALSGLTPERLGQFSDKCGSLLLDGNLKIKECAGMRPEQLYSTIRSFGASGGRVAVIDYIQIARRMGADERIAIDELMLYIQQAGKSSGVACIALSQFSRLKIGEIEPKISNLRGSGAIGQLAANAALMWAPDGDELQASAKQDLRNRGYLVPRDTRILTRIEWAKARHSAKTKEYLLFEGATMHFAPVDRP